MDLLISNVASMHHLDVQGRDADGTLPETDSETAIREEVRRVLQSRRESMNTALTFAASKGDVKQVKEREPEVAACQSCVCVCAFKADLSLRQWAFREDQKTGLERF